LLNKIFQLLTFVFYQTKVIHFLCTLNGIYHKPQPEKPDDIKYRHFFVDSQPIFEEVHTLDYKRIIELHEWFNNKLIKPINRRKESTKVDSSISCPRCHAPHHYLYDNNGSHGAYQCKVCGQNFSSGQSFNKKVHLKCPHCEHTLEKIKERNNFDIYKCRNDRCSYYLNRLNEMNDHDRELYETQPHKVKVRYIYRKYHLSFKKLAKRAFEVMGLERLPTVDLSRIHASDYVLGLVLTYRVNYGMSARKVACILKDIHEVKISHQTVINYCNAVGFLVKPFIDHYDYDLSNTICGDETYIKVNGQWNFIFYFFDASKKIILSYFTTPRRTTESAIVALLSTLHKLKDKVNLSFIVDGNPIYLAAKLFIDEKRDQNDHINIPKFNIKQVIGLTNIDDTSKKFRPLKQIIERLNRTFKRSYYTTYGFQSKHGSVCYVNLFVAYFNFLRKHQSLDYKVPVYIESIQKHKNMPAKWCQLINLSQEMITNLQNQNLYANFIE
jgi:transposase-like protein/DNA-directed RNA polymerase subunit RPC12/RpoP